MAVVTVHSSTPGPDFKTLLAKYNDLAAKFNALLAKLDADTGVADTNYVAVVGQADTIQLVY